ncbi:ABC transporter permease [Providencia sneebia]|uniref:Binding-protein-dependent transport protein n=1 Tax=Providencia sneebia DSM 19967 TaxID=1141660 RepID=K8W0V6_9GAMM|nr:ABC transporter permease [Providencia sneebia]EKT53426.1 binding-protein-dependent transport protein [Providencia sneebia DSM 19967]
MTYNPNKPLIKLLIALFCLVVLGIYVFWLSYTDVEMNLLDRRLAPSFEHWFGTDNLGRDLWDRTFQGIATSLQIGSIAAISSGIIALVMAGLSSISKTMDYLVRGIIDALLALPHLLLLVLLCFSLGGGKTGVIWAVALTHWPKLALILRSELLKIRQTDYIMLSYRIGNNALYRWRYHYLLMILPQWMVGTLLMFPHAILHSAALSFLGFGLSPHEPSLGILLSDALRYLSTGAWWLAVFPGLALMGLVLLFDQFAKSAQQLWLRGATC